MNHAKGLFVVVILAALGFTSSAHSEPGYPYWEPPKMPYWNGQIPVRDPYAPAIPTSVYPNPAAYQPYNGMGYGYAPVYTPALPANVPAGTVFIPRSVSGYDRQLGQQNVTGDLYQNGVYVGSRTYSQGYDRANNYSQTYAPYGGF